MKIEKTRNVSVRTIVLGMFALIVCVCLVAVARASATTADGMYDAHGPNATVEFEEGLYKLDLYFARGVWPSQSVMNAGVAKDAITKEPRGLTNEYIQRVLSKDFWPTPKSDMKGIRHKYDGRDAILVWDQINDNVRVECVSTTAALTVTIESPKTLDRAPKDVTKQSILVEFGRFFDVPRELLLKGEVDVATTDVAGVMIAKGVARIPSPAGTDQWRDGFRWYNSIHFWTVRGKLSATVVPFRDGGVAETPQIKLEE